MSRPAFRQNDRPFQAVTTRVCNQIAGPAGPSCRKAASASVNQFTHALAKTSVRYREAATDGDIACNRGRGTMPASKKILICAALTTGLLLQGSSCFGEEPTRLTGNWKL